MKEIKQKSYARIGLLGNPSDGFFGKTISCLIKNFCAEVILEPSRNLKIIPNKNFDLRKKLYGNKAIGKKNLELIKIARQNNCPSKFCGSGGAVFGIINNNFNKLQKNYLIKDYECEEIIL